MREEGTIVSDALDARFFAPLRRERTRRVGVELEFPVWNLAPERATDFDAVHEATDDFLSRFPFSDQVRDDQGAIYRADLTAQLHRILDIAERGLALRGYGEEPLLAPLRERADTLASPAREHLSRLERGESLDSIAVDYGSL